MTFVTFASHWKQRGRQTQFGFHPLSGSILMSFYLCDRARLLDGLGWTSPGLCVRVSRSGLDKSRGSAFSDGWVVQMELSAEGVMPELPCLSPESSGRGQERFWWGKLSSPSVRLDRERQGLLVVLDFGWESRPCAFVQLKSRICWPWKESEQS